MANNPAIQALQKELAVADAEFADLKTRYKAKHPYYIRAEEKIASLRESMNEQAKSVIASLRNNAETAKATEEQLQATGRQPEERATGTWNSCASSTVV